MLTRLAPSFEEEKDTGCNQPSNSTYANTNTNFYFWAKTAIVRQGLVAKRKSRVVKTLRVQRLLELVTIGMYDPHSVCANGCRGNCRGKRGSKPSRHLSDWQ